MSIKITQVRSTINRPAPQKRVLLALGLRRMHQTVEHDDTPTIRGMVGKIKHLVRIENTEQAAA